MFRFLILFVFVTLFTGLPCTEVEKYIKICSRNSKESNECMVKAVRSAIPVLSDGIPALEIPPLDPYHQDEWHFSYNKYQVVGKLNMSKIIVQGLRETKVRKARLHANDEHFHLEIEIAAPRIVVTGLYNAIGAYNSLKVDTSGTFNCTMLDVACIWKLDGKPVVENDVTYMKIYDFYMRPDVGRMIATGTTKDDGLKPLFALGNDFIKENWKLVYKEILPFAQASWNQTGIHISNKIFLKYPYDQLFPVQA